MIFEAHFFPHRVAAATIGQSSNSVDENDSGLQVRGARLKQTSDLGKNKLKPTEGDASVNR